MFFCPNEAPDHLTGQRLVWNLLQRALRREDGVAWYRYPLFAADDPGRLRPDVLVLSRTSGLWLLSARGDRLADFAPTAAATELAQLDAWAQALRERLASVPGLAHTELTVGIRLALPFVATAAWQQSAFADEPDLRGRTSPSMSSSRRACSAISPTMALHRQQRRRRTGGA